jgi:hypothetical protein
MATSDYSVNEYTAKLINELFTLRDDETTKDHIKKIFSEFSECYYQAFNQGIINISNVHKLFPGCTVLHFYEDIVAKEGEYFYGSAAPNTAEIIIIVVLEVKNYICILGGTNDDENERGDNVISSFNFMNSVDIFTREEYTHESFFTNSLFDNYEPPLSNICKYYRDICDDTTTHYNSEESCINHMKEFYIHSSYTESEPGSFMKTPVYKLDENNSRLKTLKDLAYPELGMPDNPYSEDMYDDNLEVYKPRIRPKKVPAPVASPHTQPLQFGLAGIPQKQVGLPYFTLGTDISQEQTTLQVKMPLSKPYQAELGLIVYVKKTTPEFKLPVDKLQQCGLAGLSPPEQTTPQFIMMPISQPQKFTMPGVPILVRSPDIQRSPPPFVMPGSKP